MRTTCPSGSIGTTATALACSTISRSATSPSGISTRSTRTFDRSPLWVTVEDLTSYFAMARQPTAAASQSRLLRLVALLRPSAAADHRGDHEDECAQQRGRNATACGRQIRAVVRDTWDSVAVRIVWWTGRGAALGRQRHLQHVDAANQVSRVDQVRVTDRQTGLVALRDPVRVPHLAGDRGVVAVILDVLRVTDVLDPHALLVV